MFPFRYYLTRFFTGRYFPKVGSGATPPTTPTSPSVILRYVERPPPVASYEDRTPTADFGERSAVIRFRR